MSRDAAVKVFSHHALALTPRMSSPIADAIGHRVPDGMHLGPYQITGFIGAGAMGEVYRAHDSNLDRVVAHCQEGEHVNRK